MVHIKDFVRKDGKLVSVAAGTGEMDYTNILRWLKAYKPYIQVSLENTCNDMAHSKVTTAVGMSIIFPNASSPAITGLAEINNE